MEENLHPTASCPPFDKKGSDAAPFDKQGSEATSFDKQGSEATSFDKQGSEATSSGGLIRLRTRLTEPTTWLGPAWACLCGVIASGGFDWQDGYLIRLALLILLVDGGWGTLWAALGGTDWATPLRRWRDWHLGEPGPALPYTLPNSPGDHVSRCLGQLRAWRRNVLWPTCGPAISSVVVALPVTILLGTLLGPELLLLSAAALAVAQLGLAWEGGRGATAPGWDAIVAVALPRLAGHIATRLDWRWPLHWPGGAHGDSGQPGDARWESAPNSWRQRSSSHCTTPWLRGPCCCCLLHNWR
jgi:hypothetical protein